MGDQVFDMTPTSGVPLLGDEDCGAQSHSKMSTRFAVFTNAGSYVLTGTYQGFADVYPLTVSQVRLVQVRDNKLHYENGRVYWFGSGSYELQASEDLQTWSRVATVAGQSGYYQYRDNNTNQPKRFYRTRRL